MGWLFWVIAAIMVVLVVIIIGGGRNTSDPLGGDGGSGCFTKGCFIRVGIVLLLIIFLSLLIAFFYLYGQAS